MGKGGPPAVLSTIEINLRKKKNIFPKYIQQSIFSLNKIHICICPDELALLWLVSYIPNAVLLVLFKLFIVIFLVCNIFPPMKYTPDNDF